MYTYRQFNAAGAAQSKSMEKLSSGLRINKAGDDAAGDVLKFKVGNEEFTIAAADGTNAGTVPVTAGANKVSVGTEGGAATAQHLANALNLLSIENPDSVLNEFTFSNDSGQLKITAKAGGQFDGVKGKDAISITTGPAEYLTQSVADGEVGEDGTGGEAKLQIGANKDQSFTIEIQDMRAKNLGIASTSGGADADSTVGNATFTSTSANQLTDVSDTVNDTPEYALDVTTHEKATSAIKVIDSAIEKVSAERSKLGAYQNRLDHTINNLSTSSENLTAAESRIRDVDYALAA